MCQTRPSRPTQPSRRSVCLRPSCSPLHSSDPRSVPGDVARWSTSVRAATAALPQGPSLRTEFFCPGPSTLNRPHPPHSQAHPDFTALRLIPDAFAVHTAPRRPSSGSALSLPVLLTCRPQRPRGDRNRFVPDMRFRHRPSPCYERLGSPDYPAIRFTQGRLFGASWFAFAAACQVARPLCRSDQSASGHRGFYLQASDESVTLLAAGYNYDSHWNVLSKGLAPFGMTASVAAP